MQPVMDSVLAGLPVLLLHLGTALIVFLLALITYLWLTPHNEVALIRAGNEAAAISLAGAALGLAIPMAACLHGSVNVWDIAIWGAIILVIQLVAFRAVDLVLRDLSRRIEADQRAAALLLAGVKVACAFLNAAAIAG